MKSRESMLRLKHFQVEDKTRQLTQIDLMIGEFTRMADEAMGVHLHGMQGFLRSKGATEAVVNRIPPTATNGGCHEAHSSRFILDYRCRRDGSRSDGW